jgi:transposase
MLDIKKAKSSFEFLFTTGALDEKKFAKAFNIHPSTIRRWKSWMKTRKTLEHKKGAGRPRILAKADLTRLRSLADYHQSWPAAALAARLQKLGSPKVSRATCHRYLQDLNFKKLVPRACTILTEKHIAARVEFCKRHINWTVADWASYVFTDESRFELNRMKSPLWSHKSPRRVPKKKFDDSFMIWGGISVHGGTPVAFITGNINSDKYQEIIDDALPTLNTLFGGQNWTLQQDNASCHVSKATMAWLASKNISTLSWPANSPDLNVIEILWAIMKARIEKEKPKTKVAFKKLIEEEWARAESDGTMKKLIESMPRRIASCLAAKGKHFTS